MSPQQAGDRPQTTLALFQRNRPIVDLRRTKLWRGSTQRGKLRRRKAARREWSDMSLFDSTRHQNLCRIFAVRRPAVGGKISEVLDFIGAP